MASHYLPGQRWVHKHDISIHGKQIHVKQYTNPYGLTGTTLWDSSFVLVKYFETSFPKEYWKGKRILELGSGTGVVGISIAAMGAKVYLTDICDILPLLEDNVALNSDLDISVRELNWLKLEGNEDLIGKLDFVVASDCIWLRNLVVPFVQALKYVIGGNKECTVYIGHEKRTEIVDQFFLETLKKDFHVEDVKYKHDVFSSNRIHIYKAKLK